MSTIIKLRCVDQVLAFETTPVIASGGLQEDFIQVSFCSKWTGLAKTAVFWRNEKDAYHVLLDENGRGHIPPEVLIDEGRVYFGVFGVDPAGKQRTSQVVGYNITKGAITEGTKPSDPTPELYTELLTQYAAIVSLYTSKMDKVTGATAGNFAALTADGSLLDSGKSPTSFIDLQVGPDDPLTGPTLWFNTSGENPALIESVLLDLDDEPEGDVSAEIGDEEYGVGNATVNTEPTESGVYDFNITE